MSQAHFKAVRTRESSLMRRTAVHSSFKVCHLGHIYTLNWCFTKESVMNFRARIKSQRTGTQVQATGRVDQGFNKSVKYPYLLGVPSRKKTLLVCLDWWPKWQCLGMVLHPSWFTQRSFLPEGYRLVSTGED